MSIPCSICTEISENSNLRPDQKGYRSDTAAVVRTKRYWNHWSRGLPWPYPYADNFSTEVQHFLRHGISQGKEQSHNFWQTCKPEVSVWRTTLLGRGYYVDTVGRNKKQIAEYIKHQLDEDQIADQMSMKEFIDPFTGSKNTKALSVLCPSRACSSPRLCRGSWLYRKIESVWIPGNRIEDGRICSADKNRSPFCWSQNQCAKSCHTNWVACTD